MANLNFYIIFMFCVILNLNNSAGQNGRFSPCPNIFEYGKPGIGYITVPSFKIGQSLTLSVEFWIPIILPSQYVGELNLSTTKEETQQAILSGAEYIQYTLRFPLTTPQSEIIQILYNGTLICAGLSDVRATTGTNVKLRYTIKSYQIVRFVPAPNGSPYNQNNGIVLNQSGSVASDRDNIRYKNQNEQQNRIRYEVPTRPFIIPDRSFSLPNDNNQQQTQGIIPHEQPPATTQLAPLPMQQHISTNMRDENICGIIDSQFRVNPLIIGGDVIIHGTWPWLAAIFLSNEPRTLKFTCGGTLVSSRIVVSAAHCFFTKGGSAVESKDVIVHLGRHNLHIWEEENKIQRLVVLLKIHDDYKRSNAQSFDADIAIMVLNKVINYNLYIRPICLWSGNNNIQEVEHQLGTIVGWGVNESGEPAIEPTKVDIPIVPEVTCLRSANIFNKITSNRTFCAGYRDDQRGPCNGDSGSGFALMQNDRWTLRGIVSVSGTVDAIKRKCDLSQFVVFTDASIFVDWIRDHIDLIKN